MTADLRAAQLRPWSSQGRRKPRARVRDLTIIGPCARAVALPYARGRWHARAVARQCIDVDQAADGGLEEEGDGLSMSRAILTAQKHGQLDKRRLHSTLFTWCLKEIV